MNIEKLKNGNFKYREKYKDPLTGKWKSVTITYEKNNRHIEKLAQKELNEKINNIISNTASSHKEITLKQLVEVYLKDAKGHLKDDSTYPIRVHSMNRVAKILGPETLISKLTPLYLNRTIPNNHLKTHSKILLNWAYKNEYLDKKLGDFIKMESKDKKTLDDVINGISDEKEYYTKEQLKEIFDTLTASKYYSEKILRLILESQTILGKRFSEIIALCEDDIDEKNQIAHIYKRCYCGSINTPKTERTIDDLGINKRMIQIKKEAIFIKKMYGVESEFLFPRKSGESYSYQTAKNILKKRGFNTKTHIFRKTCASLLAEHGVPLKYIQDRLGHEDDKVTTQIYIQITDKMKKEEQDYFKHIDIL